MKVSWAAFKNFHTYRQVDILMIEESDAYHLILDDRSANLTCHLDRNPSDTTELDDFEDNYLSLCNPQKQIIITPTPPLNNHEMIHFGLIHAHINSSDHIFDLTLSNKSGKTYSYSCTQDPAAYSIITNDDNSTFDEIVSVDTENNTILTRYGHLSNVSCKLVNPKIIDYVFPDDHEFYQLWGCFVHAKDHGDDDHCTMQIIEPQSGLVLKEYDDIWVQTIVKTTEPIFTPDGAPGNIPAGLVSRVLYYPKDITKTDIKFWGDKVLTIES